MYFLFQANRSITIRLERFNFTKFVWGNSLSHETVRGSAMHWVGIGASAGGLEALRKVIQLIGLDIDATYIVAQHMAPHHRSLLTSIIARETSLPVIELDEDIEPARAVVYITPPNANIRVEDGMLRLSEPSQEVGIPKPSVDVFLSSMAAELGGRAVGVILSGTGSDGADGIKSVRQHGGITVAQDEESAKYPGMPMSAVETGAVDYVLSPEEIGGSLQAILDRSPSLSLERQIPMAKDALSELLAILLHHSRVDFNQYKSATVSRRIERRIAAVKATDLDTYVAHVKENTQELDALFKDLLISVTSFFRDVDEFMTLKQALTDLVKRKGDEDIRVWIPGVATGEEAYTIAIIFAEVVGGLKAFVRRRIQIFATDIDESAIAVARRAYYPETALLALDQHILKNYFEPCPGGVFVQKAIREKVVFSMHNIAADPPFLNLDLISCRNLLIYFDQQLQSAVFERFHYAINSGGLLFLGKSEAVSATAELFQHTAVGKHIFRKKTTGRRRLNKRYPEMPFSYQKVEDVSGGDKSRTEIDLLSLGSQLESLVQSIGPNAVLVDRDLRINRVYGNINRFVGITSGADNLRTDVTTLLLEPWSQDIRVAIPGVLKNGRVYKGLSRSTEKDAERARVVIYPMRDDAKQEDLALVVLETWTDSATEVRTADTEEDVDLLRKTIKDLSAELTIARGNLESSIADLETSNEELQALNEELQSSNEELQSTNEELETSNEELQSTNEELSTVNEEFQVSAQQLNQLNQQLNSILFNLRSAMLVLDKDLYVIHASARAADFFNFPGDVMEPHISRCNLSGIDNLEVLVSDVRNSGDNLSIEIDTDDVGATMSISTYRSPADDYEGIILQVHDNTMMLTQTKSSLRQILDVVPLGIGLHTETGRVVTSNEKFGELIGVDTADLTGRNIYELLPDKYATEQRDADRVLFELMESRLGEQIPFESPDRGLRQLRVSRVPFVSAASNEKLSLVMAEDITDEMNREEQRRLLYTRLEQVAKASKTGVWEVDISTGETYWSGRMHEIVGISSESKASSEALFQLVHDEDKETFDKSFSRAKEGGDSIDVEIRLVRDNGDTSWISIHGDRFDDETGQARKLVGIALDITEMRVQFTELEKKHAQMKMTERLLDVGYWIVHRNSENSLFWSHQVYRIFGVDSALFTPDMSTVFDLYHPEDRDRVRETVSAALDRREDFRFSAKIVRPDGEERVVESIGQSLTLAGDPVLYGALRDVTDVVSTKQKIESYHWQLAIAAVNAFDAMYTARVELPRSMQSILRTSAISERLEGQSRGQFQALMQKLGDSQQHSSSMIDDVKGHHWPNPQLMMEEIDLATVVTEVLAALDPAIKKSNAVVDVRRLGVVTGRASDFVLLFHTLLEMALAVDDVPEAKVKISSEPGNNALTFWIEDNWQKFSQDLGENPEERLGEVKFSGVVVCRVIVEGYGGSISFLNSSMGGSRVEVTIPAKGIGDNVQRADAAGETERVDRSDA
jgi:two-component system CheB/CheR fusion protein